MQGHGHPTMIMSPLQKSSFDMFFFFVAIQLAMVCPPVPVAIVPVWSPLDVFVGVVAEEQAAHRNTVENDSTSTPDFVNITQPHSDSEDRFEQVPASAALGTSREAATDTASNRPVASHTRNVEARRDRDLQHDEMMKMDDIVEKEKPPENIKQDKNATHNKPGGSSAASGAPHGDLSTTSNIHGQHKEENKQRKSRDDLPLLLNFFRRSSRFSYTVGAAVFFLDFLLDSYEFFVSSVRWMLNWLMLGNEQRPKGSTTFKDASSTATSSSTARAKLFTQYTQQYSLYSRRRLPSGGTLEENEKDENKRENEHKDQDEQQDPAKAAKHLLTETSDRRQAVHRGQVQENETAKMASASTIFSNDTERTLSSTVATTGVKDEKTEEGQTQTAPAAKESDVDQQALQEEEHEHSPTATHEKNDTKSSATANRNPSKVSSSEMNLNDPHEQEQLKKRNKSSSHNLNHSLLHWILRIMELCFFTAPNFGLYGLGAKVFYELKICLGAGKTPRIYFCC